MWKVFIKEMLELCSSRQVLLLLFVVPIVLIGLIGQLSERDPVIRIFVDAPYGDSRLSEPLVRLLRERNAVEVAALPRGDLPVWDFLAANKLDMAFVWESSNLAPPRARGAWYVYSQPANRKQAMREQQLVLLLRSGARAGQLWPWWKESLENGANNALYRMRAFPVLYRDGLPSARSTWLVPRVTALIVIFVPFMLASITLVRERENSTFAVLALAPGVSRLGIFWGKALLSVLVAAILLLLLSLLARTFFDLGIKPGFSGALALQVVAACAATFQGMIISSWVRSQFHALLASAAYLVALVLLTGLLYPVEQSATTVQVVSRMFPLTYSGPPLSAWMSHGTGAYHYGHEFVWLTGVAVVSGILAVLSYRRSLQSL